MFQNLVKSLSPFCREKIRRNIEIEWVRSANALCPTRVFFRNENPTQIMENQKSLKPIDNVIEMYNTELKHWIGNETSFAVIERSLNNCLTMFLMSPKKETLQQQQCLIRSRNHWYKEHSKSPLTSGFKSIVDEDKDCINIVYKAKHLNNDNNENVHQTKKSNTRTLVLDEIYINKDIQNNDNNVENSQVQDYDIIYCRTDMNNCLDAFLDDSYSHCSDGKSVLKLNRSLVPFKLAITFETDFDEKSRKKSFEVVNYLLNQLKECQEISVFPFVKDCILDVDTADQLLIPFCVIVTPGSLKNGVVLLRNRDTRISESVHVSNFLKTVLMYLMPIKLL